MVTYESIIKAGEGLKKIATLDLKIGQAIRLSKLIKKLGEESVYYFEQRNRLCAQFGKYEPEKDAYFIPEENRKALAEKMTELNEETVDVGEKLKIAVPDGAVIDAVSLLLAEDFIEFVFEEDKENGE